MTRRRAHQRYDEKVISEWRWGDDVILLESNDTVNPGDGRG